MQYSSVRSRVEALSEPERSARLRLYSEEDWDIKWELNAWPHQLAPSGDDWKAWTVIGPPGSGKTIAGYMWARSKFYDVESSYDILAIFRHPKDVERIGRMFYRELGDRGIEKDFDLSTTYTRIRFEERNPLSRPTRLHLVAESEVTEGTYLRGREYDYIWADEIEDARMLMYQQPTTKQFAFTGPTRLPDDTLLSRAQ